MFAGHDDEVGAILESLGTVPAARLAQAWDEHRLSRRSLASVAVEQGIVTRGDLLRAIGERLGAEVVAAVPPVLPDRQAAPVPSSLARAHRIVPWREEAGRLVVLAADPFARQLEADLAFALGREVRLAVGDPDRIEALVHRHYGEEEGPAATALEGVGEPDRDADPAALARQAPIVRFVNLVLAQAIRERASDVHFEPFEAEFRIRCRIDGALIDLPAPPAHLARAITSRLKVLADLDIAERRVPQDGRIRAAVDGRTVDLRVSTLPTQFGESVVLRVLDQAAMRLDLRAVGLPAREAAAWREVIRRPNGIVIVTGPTGSGKTTTLYACLQELNDPGAKLLTVEDPVEYEIEGVMQVPVNPAAGLIFASALRAFLRQDPDIVMVGEIRDLETAQIAVQAALTGHLVLTTLHTNDAPGAVTRLLDMGVERFLLAATLEAVLAQRLVRRVCPDCREQHEPDPAWLARVGEEPGAWAGVRLWRGRGCARCHGTGYRGRRGFFELLVADDELRDLVGSGAAPARLREAARSRGGRTLRDDGLRLVREGETTLEELARYC